MTINGFERIFTNNSEYAKPDGTAFMDSLAFTVQEFLYAQLIQSITGLPLQTCKNYCSDPHLNTTTHSEEILKMNTLLQALGMKIHL